MRRFSSVLLIGILLTSLVFIFFAAGVQPAVPLFGFVASVFGMLALLPALCVEFSEILPRSHYVMSAWKWRRSSPEKKSKKSGSAKSSGSSGSSGKPKKPAVKKSGKSTAPKVKPESKKSSPSGDKKPSTKRQPASAGKTAAQSQQTRLKPGARLARTSKKTISSRDGTARSAQSVVNQPTAASPTRRRRVPRRKSTSQSLRESWNTGWSRLRRGAHDLWNDGRSASREFTSSLSPQSERPQVQVQPKKSGAGKTRSLSLKSEHVHFSGPVEHRCPYCLDEVVVSDPRGVRICPECGTRHHADCWAVTGTCQVPHE